MCRNVIENMALSTSLFTVCVCVCVCVLSSVPSFEASKYPITNGEFLEFATAGGYSRRNLWTDEGWQWVQERQARHPTFWICSHGFTPPAVLLSPVACLNPYTLRYFDTSRRATEAAVGLLNSKIAILISSILTK